MNYQMPFFKNRKKKENIFSSIENIIDYIYSQNFPQILNEEKTKFLNNIETEITDLLKLKFKDNEAQYRKEISLYEKNKEKIKTRYESDFLLLKSEFKKYKKSPNKYSYLARYRKHCLNSGKVPIHKCSNNKYGKFIEIFTNNTKNLTNKLNISKNNSSYIICDECSCCYMNSFIKIHCFSCKCDYYSSKLEEGENENILPATWKEYHCRPIIINEVMKCIKCENILYINLITKKLVCLNKNCNFTTNQNSILWKCKICKNDFRSMVKVFNPLEIKVLQNEVKKCLIYKIPALPKKLFCCAENEKYKNIKYFHDKKCKGDLYKWSYDNREIIVCGLCHAVNLYEKFIWTCPVCYLRFNYHGKKQKNEDEINKNLILKNSQKNIKNTISQNQNHNYNSEKRQFSEKTKDNENASNSNKKRLIHRQYFSSNIKILTRDEDHDDRDKFNINNLIYENNYTIPSIEVNNTIDIYKYKNSSFIKNENEIINNHIHIEQNSIPKTIYSKKKKKIRYQTLFDILEEREKYKYKISNQNNIKKDDNNNAQIKPNSSPKKETLFQKYYNKRTTNLNKEKRNSIINISYLDDKNIFNNINEQEYINKNLQKKFSSDLNRFSFGFMGMQKQPEKNKSNLHSSNFKKHLFSKNTEVKNNRYKLKDEINKNISKDKIYPKKNYMSNNIYEKNDSEREKVKEINIDKGDISDSTKWKKNQIIKRIFLNKMKQNTRNLLLNEKEDEFSNNNNIQFNNFNCTLEMKISPLGDIGQDIVSKDKFLKIAEECKIPTFNENNIKYLTPIGQGSYGVIYSVEEKDTKKQYALKSILCNDIEQILKHKKEFELSYSLSHPNIIKIHNVLFKYLDMTTYLLYILMEKAETDWNSEIEKRKKSQNFYTEIELINILKQLVSVLYYFQKNNIAHRDIKPQNILICSNNVYKITDFGEAKKCNNSKLATLKGSQLFMSPNLFLVLKYDGNGTRVKHNIFKSDVFSLGYCFLYAMTLDLKIIKNLREETSMIDVDAILKKFEIDKKYSQKFLDIIYKMIQTDENKRYDFFELNEEINKYF